MLSAATAIDETPAATGEASPLLNRIHARRLREVYRSAGWPCQDAVEVELLAAGLLVRADDGGGHETVRVTDAGIHALAGALRSNRAAYSAHCALEALVAREMQQAGRVVWRGLCLRAQVPVTKPRVSEPGNDGLVDALATDLQSECPALRSAATHRWCLAKPDVYSIRSTSVAEYVQPIVHEVKVRRADLLGDLKKLDKRAAYLDMASECWYVLGCDGRGRAIADASEIPLECGVMVQAAGRLQVLRAAPRRAMVLPFRIWMALAKAAALRTEPNDAQIPLARCN